MKTRAKFQASILAGAVCLALIPGVREAQSFVLQTVEDSFDPGDPFNDDARTGIAIGERIPSFRALDAHGATWDFDALKGPRGALILFHRSADW